MKNLLCVLAVGSLVACGKSGGGAADDWTKKPLETVKAKAKDVEFTIDVPKGMRQKDDNGTARFDFHIDGYVKTPEFSVNSGGFAKTLEDYVKFESKVDNWVRKEALPDGYVVSYENTAYKGKEDYIVYVYRTFGDKVLTCNARVTPWTKGATVKDKLPQAEKVCLSVKPAS